MLYYWLARGIWVSGFIAPRIGTWKLLLAVVGAWEKVARNGASSFLLKSVPTLRRGQKLQLGYVSGEPLPQQSRNGVASQSPELFYTAAHEFYGET